MSLTITAAHNKGGGTTKTEAQQPLGPQQRWKRAHNEGDETTKATRETATNENMEASIGAENNKRKSRRSEAARGDLRESLSKTHQRQGGGGSEVGSDPVFCKVKNGEITLKPVKPRPFGREDVRPGARNGAAPRPIQP